MTLLIIAFLALFFWERILVSIYPGHVGVLWRRFSGTVTDRVYGEGLHFVLPVNIMYSYDVRWHIVRRSLAKVIVLGDKADLPLLIGTVPLGQDGQLPTK